GRVPVGVPIALSEGAAAELTLDTGAKVAIDGPGRLTLDGSARDVAVNLAEGKLRAEVAHRQPDQTFAVITRHARVDVRGTKFSVDATADASHVAVTEGQVAVR